MLELILFLFLSYLLCDELLLNTFFWQFCTSSSDSRGYQHNAVCQVLFKLMDQRLVGALCWGCEVLSPYWPGACVSSWEMKRRILAKWENSGATALCSSGHVGSTQLLLLTHSQNVHPVDWVSGMKTYWHTGWLWHKKDTKAFLITLLYYEHSTEINKCCKTCYQYPMWNQGGTLLVLLILCNTLHDRPPWDM